MTLTYPSREFDDAVAAVCHGWASEEQTQALNSLLRTHPEALDEYLLRVEIHSRLASDPDLFPASASDLNQASRFGIENVPSPSSRPDASRDRGRSERRSWAIGLAAALAVSAGVWWWGRLAHPVDNKGVTSEAVAMLDRVVHADWAEKSGHLAPGAPLEPGWFRLESGLAQVVFYNGARVVIQGPTEIELVSKDRAFCRKGRLTAEVPPQARGFRMDTPHLRLTDLESSFGLEVRSLRSELHVFQGKVAMQTADGTKQQSLGAGAGAVIEASNPPKIILAAPERFASLFDLQPQSAAEEALRYDEWRSANQRLNTDPSLVLHLDFEQSGPSDWRLHHAGLGGSLIEDAAVVGCEWTGGRWPGKRALEFQSVNDRVRMNVPGAFDSLTLTAWVRVQGLDRQINSLFMCDGFAPGTLHWLIRSDGVLGLTVIGPEPGNYQIAATDPLITVDQFGRWLHLAVVIDADEKRVLFYLDGRVVGGKPLQVAPPFVIGSAELGNWNGKGFPDDDPFLIRNFSGAMDEFCLFTRALGEEEIHSLYSDGNPRPVNTRQR